MQVTADDDEADVDTGGDDDEDDSDGWITPGNLSQKRREMNGMKEEDKVQKVKVACMTTDFAMQVRPIRADFHLVQVPGPFFPSRMSSSNWECTSCQWRELLYARLKPGCSGATHASRPPRSWTRSSAKSAATRL